MSVQRNIFLDRVSMFVLCSVAACLSFSVGAWASGPNPDGYPLRVHILKRVVRPGDTYAMRNPANMADYIQGEGAADVFENGEPHGFLFNYACIEPLRASGGYATYPARWKKRDKTLEILIPQTGKPWNLEACDLKTAMRPGLAYFWNDADDTVVEQSSVVFKEWMLKHHYNPEQDMDLPIDAGVAPDGASGTGWSSSQKSGSH